jgi:hypothetical protein
VHYPDQVRGNKKDPDCTAYEHTRKNKRYQHQEEHYIPFFKNIPGHQPIGNGIVVSNLNGHVQKVIAKRNPKISLERIKRSDEKRYDHPKYHVLPETWQLNIIEHQIETIIHIANLLQNSLIELLLRRIATNCNHLMTNCKQVAVPIAFCN